MLRKTSAAIALASMLAFASSAFAAKPYLAKARAHAIVAITAYEQRADGVAGPVHVTCSGAPARITCLGSGTTIQHLPWHAEDVLAYHDGKFTTLEVSSLL